MLAAAVLAGCQHGAQHRPAGGDGGAPPRLTTAQSADVRMALARTLEQRGDVEQAGRTYAGVVRDEPDRADACLRLANLRARQGQFAEAVALYRRVLEAEPASADVYCNLGYTQYLRGEWDEAEWALRKSLSIKPDHQRAHNNLGLVLARAGKADEALDEFRRAGCSALDGRLNLGYARTLAGDWAGAQDQYRRALALDPTSDAARTGLARAEALGNGPGPGSPAPALADQGAAPAPAERPAVTRAGWPTSQPTGPNQPASEPVPTALGRVAGGDGWGATGLAASRPR